MAVFGEGGGAQWFSFIFRKSIDVAAQQNEKPRTWRGLIV
jgi:hypothetical protein